MSKLTKEQQRFSDALCKKHGLEPYHIVFMGKGKDWKPYITVDGHIKIMHNAGDCDGYEIEKEERDDGVFFTKATVWRKGVTRGVQGLGHSGNSRLKGYDKLLHAETKAKGRAIRNMWDVPYPTPEEYWDVVAHEKAYDMKVEGSKITIQSGPAESPPASKKAKKQEYQPKRKMTEKELDEIMNLISSFGFTVSDLNRAMSLTFNSSNTSIFTLSKAFSDALKVRLKAGMSDDEQTSVAQIKALEPKELLTDWAFYILKKDSAKEKSIFHALTIAQSLGDLCDSIFPV